MAAAAYYGGERKIPNYASARKNHAGGRGMPSLGEYTQQVADYVSDLAPLSNAARHAAIGPHHPDYTDLVDDLLESPAPERGSTGFAGIDAPDAPAAPDGAPIAAAPRAQPTL